MSITAFGFREEATTAATIMERTLDRERTRLEQLYGLQGDELALVSLLVQGRSKRKVAALLEKPAHEVDALRNGLMRRLGLRNVRDLVELARMTGLGWNPTPAQYLARYVLPQLEGGRIIGSVLKERDWCGLVIRLANGEQITAWIDRDETQDCGGFLTLERCGESAEERSTAWLRQAVAEKVEQLISLLDELDGDSDFESEDLEDEGISEAWLQPASLGPALRTIRQRANRRQPGVPLETSRKTEIEQLTLGALQADRQATKYRSAQQADVFAGSVLTIPAYQAERILTGSSNPFRDLGREGAKAHARLIDAWSDDMLSQAAEGGGREA